MRGGPLDLSRARILVTNDDGIGAPGLAILARVARNLTRDVWVVAPEVEQSAASHSLTVRTPLRLNRLGRRRYSVSGTPTDCVLLAVGQVLGDRGPDLVLSGINHGGNMAEDISHSGTVAAAMQATVVGVRGIAFSQICKPQQPIRWPSDSLAAEIVRKLVALPWPSDVFMNVNFPDRPTDSVNGIEITRQGRRRLIQPITESFDPFGAAYYWIGSPRKEQPGGADCDVDAAARGAVTVTPLKLDLTHRATMSRLREAFA